LRAARQTAPPRFDAHFETNQPGRSRATCILGVALLFVTLTPAVAADNTPDAIRARAMQCIKELCERALPFIELACASTCVRAANFSVPRDARLPEDAFDAYVRAENEDRRNLAQSGPVDFTVPGEELACAQAAASFRKQCEQRGAGSCYEGAIQLQDACLRDGLDDEIRAARKKPVSAKNYERCCAMIAAGFAVSRPTGSAPPRPR
jgi:hypothetical protein